MWLKVLAENKINITLAPHSAYAATLEAWKATSPRERPGLAVGGARGAWDFSNLVHLISTGEPVQAPVIREFLDAFKKGGLKSSCFKVSRRIRSLHTSGLIVCLGHVQHAGARCVEIFESDVIRFPLTSCTAQ